MIKTASVTFDVQIVLRIRWGVRPTSCSVASRRCNHRALSDLLHA